MTGRAGMAPLIYPEPTWSNRFGRVVRTVQVVAVAGAIGAVGGGVAVMALIGGGSAPRQATALNVSTTYHAKAGTTDNAAAHPVSAAPAAPQPNAAATAAQVAPSVATAAPSAAQAAAQQSSAAAEPSADAAATAQHPVQQAAEPVGSSPGTHLYNSIEPQQTAPAHTARPRAKVTRRLKSAEHGRQERGAPYAAERGRYSDERGGPYDSGRRYSYRDYDPPPVVRAPPPAVRGYYFGGGRGGVYYDRGDWGD
jgi:hypothetical protein